MSVYAEFLINRMNQIVTEKTEDELCKYILDHKLGDKFLAFVDQKDKPNK